jgi:hypothetical protein
MDWRSLPSNEDYLSRLTDTAPGIQSQQLALILTAEVASGANAENWKSA